jgi:hypothetical protein
MPFFLIVDVESILGEEEVWLRQARLTVRRGHNVWINRLIVIKNLLVFPEAPFPYSGCGIHTRWGGSLVALARVTFRTGHNFWFDRWIVIKILHEFLDALFHIVDVESILGEDEVWSRQARLTVRTGHNFWSDCWIVIKILHEFLDALFPYSGCGIDTRWGGGLVAPG